MEEQRTVPTREATTGLCSFPVAEEAWTGVGWVEAEETEDAKRVSDSKNQDEAGA